MEALAIAGSFFFNFLQCFSRLVNPYKYVGEIVVNILVIIIIIRIYKLYIHIYIHINYQYIYTYTKSLPLPKKQLNSLPFQNILQ